MAARKRERSQRGPSRQVKPVGIRIIGGSMGGRRIQYTGDQRTRPMKDRLRQAVFDLLGPSVKNKWAVDLFAGSGALGFEAISRGAAGATLIEQHFPTARVMRENAKSLGIDEQVEVVTSNVFIWNRVGRELPDRPWVIFCSPPWSFFCERLEEMRELVGSLWESSPAESLLVVESDTSFDFEEFSSMGTWDIRPYPPALIGLLEKS